MVDALDVAAPDARALAHRADILARLVHPGGQAGPELLALNRDAPRLPGLHVKIDDAGRWTASTDHASTSGRGAVALVATLANIDTTRAAAFLARLLPPEAA